MQYQTPIVLFVYNRPKHTLKILEAIHKNELSSKSILYIFADQIEENSPVEDQKKVEEVRKIIRQKQWCKEVIITEREKHLGLADSIIKGVTEVVNIFGKVIVLEDDIIISPFFLNYMNDALELYKDEEKVMSIGSCNFFSYHHPQSTFFLPATDCWGWATWKNRWALFEQDSAKLLQIMREKSLLKKFNADNSYPYEEILNAQINGKIDSWAIRWYASSIIYGKLTLYPSKSLSRNIGFDGSGTHSHNYLNQVYKPKAFAKKNIIIRKIEVEQNEKAYQDYKIFNKALDGERNFFKRMKNLIKRVLK